MQLLKKRVWWWHQGSHTHTQEWLDTKLVLFALNCMDFWNFREMFGLWEIAIDVFTDKFTFHRILHNVFRDSPVNISYNDIKINNETYFVLFWKGQEWYFFHVLHGMAFDWFAYESVCRHFDGVFLCQIFTFGADLELGLHVKQSFTLGVCWYLQLKPCEVS